MTLRELANELRLSPRTGEALLDRDITRGYASDLLSDVIAHAEEGDLWITLQTHQNIVAVAVMKSLGAITLVNGREPTPETVARAKAEQVPILVGELPAFELIGRLYQLGIRGL